MVLLMNEVSYECIVKEKLNMILKEKFECNDEKIKLLNDNRLLSSKIGFSAADILELFLEIEKTFKIVFTREDILDTQFDNYNELIKIITKKTGGKS